MEVEPFEELKKESDSSGEQDQKERRKFWNVYHEQGYAELCRQYASVTWKDKLLFGIVRPLLIKMRLR